MSHNVPDGGWQRDYYDYITGGEDGPDEDEELDRASFDGTINLLCGRCGNAVRTPRSETDPPDAVLLETSYCEICDVGGQFDTPRHYRRDGSACDYMEFEESKA